MKENEVVECLGCGEKNRLNDISANKHYRCANCKMPLFNPITKRVVFEPDEAYKLMYKFFPNAYIEMDDEHERYSGTYRFFVDDWPVILCRDGKARKQGKFAKFCYETRKTRPVLKQVITLCVGLFFTFSCYAVIGYLGEGSFPMACQFAVLGWISWQFLKWLHPSLGKKDEE